MSVKPLDYSTIRALYDKSNQVPTKPIIIEETPKKQSIIADTNVDTTFNIDINFKINFPEINETQEIITVTPPEVNETQEISTVTTPEIISIKKKKQLSETQYNKKLEKKNIKLEQKQKENEQKQKENNEKINIIKIKAQEAYDKEYIVQNIECKTEQEAIEKSKLVKQKVYDELYAKEFSNKNATKTLIPIIEETVPPEILDNISDSDDEIEINFVKSDIPVKKIKSNKIVTLNTNKKNDPLKYKEMLIDSKNKFVDEIFSSENINLIKNTFNENNKNPKPYVRVFIDTTNNIILKYMDQEFTKTKFLENNNFNFSKYLSYILSEKLSLNFWIVIKQINETKYAINFSIKKVLQQPI